jgi:hypothetical protein
MRQSALSTEFVWVGPISPSLGGTPYDPSADPVQMAFTLDDAEPTEWYTAAWAASGSTSWAIKCLVGPDGGVVTLEPGSYTVFWTAVDNPETPVKRADGILTIY